ncbi:MAG: signal transduction histidine kinase [Chlamydiales bacterium]|jgi:signal transduction histidine kinase
MSVKENKESVNDDDLGSLFRFLNTVFHNLKSPIGAMISYTSALKMGIDGDVNEKQMESLEMIMKSGSNAINMIQSIREISQLKSGVLQIEIDTADINDLIRYSIEDCQKSAKEKGLEIKENLPEEELLANVDSKQIMRAINLLLTNAIEYTSEGWIILEAKKNEDSTIDIVVKDTGKGIEEDDIESILHAYDNESDKEGKQYAKKGFGLLLTRLIVEEHKGQISVSSVVNEGSSFTISIPQNL